MAQRAWLLTRSVDRIMHMRTVSAGGMIDRSPLRRAETFNTHGSKEDIP